MTQHHSEIYYILMSYLASLLTAFAYVWHWLGTNQPSITALCGLIGAAIAIYSFLMQIKERQLKKRAKNANNGRKI